MRNVRRYFKEGNTYFLTHVTYGRQPILIDHIDILRKSIDKHRNESNFKLIAWVVLPDHWHCLIDPTIYDLADLMKRIKLSFAMSYVKRIGETSGRTWQNRYWDHIIRNQEDMNNHLNYIHFNPVKHGYVTAAKDWAHSSFRDFVDAGHYHIDWGVKDDLTFTGEYGE